MLSTSQDSNINFLMTTNCTGQISPLIPSENAQLSNFISFNIVYIMSLTCPELKLLTLISQITMMVLPVQICYVKIVHEIFRPSPLAHKIPSTCLCTCSNY